MSERIVVYAGTRNLYPDISAPIKSLLANSSVDKIYLLIEDDEFPYELPDMVETINVSNQKFFLPNSPNYRSLFTYMALIRICYTKILPETVSKVLQLDVDTIVTNNIDPLWDIDMTGKWYGAVAESQSWYKPYGNNYYNIGVCLFNLEQIRKDHADDMFIELLNRQKLLYLEQDALNWKGQDKVVPLEPRYNESNVTPCSNNPAIVHFAAVRDWQTNKNMPRKHYLDKFREMSWEDALRLHKEVKNSG